MAWRSELNHNLCLDPAGGFGKDANGQSLILWHCHGGREQQFSAKPMFSFKTNGPWDMERDCSRKSNADRDCFFVCPSASSSTWVNVLFEGVKFACGLAKSSGAGLVCVTAVSAFQGITAPNGSCTCRCQRRRDDCRGGRCFQSLPGSPDTESAAAAVARNGTLEALIASHNNAEYLEEFVPMHPDLKLPATLVPIASVVKQNPTLATILAAHTTANAAKPTATVGPVLTKTHIVTKPTVTATGA
ncbi:hypothetical protein H9P43_002632 [Blastocladiella emersonii ATCC 22665]|nr:hypothetical protein H9P43_002632 [Blastocladiella emersonii ATCC 22665]